MAQHSNTIAVRPSPLAIAACANGLSERPWQTYWPVESLREDGSYCYQQQIAEYLTGCCVRVVGRGEMLLLGGYSYLGLNRHPAIEAAAISAVRRYGTGTHGVRLLSGTLDLHRELEATIAAFKNTEAALTFSSGYMANLSTVSAIVGRHDTVICDKLNHASISMAARCQARDSCASGTTT